MHIETAQQHNPLLAICMHYWFAVGGVAYLGYFGQSNNWYYQPAWVFSKVFFELISYLPVLIKMSIYRIC
jgi:hypothetical protein